MKVCRSGSEAKAVGTDCVIGVVEPVFPKVQDDASSPVMIRHARHLAAVSPVSFSKYLVLGA